MVGKEDECWRHANSESSSKIKSKNTYCILLQYPQQKCHMFFKKLEKNFYSGVLTFTNRYKWLKWKAKSVKDGPLDIFFNAL